MRRFYLTFSLLIYTFSLGFAQISSQTSFSFVDIPASSRVAALGGSAINIFDSDLSLSYGNPALLNPSMDNQAVFSYALFLAGSGYGFFSYGRDFKDIGTFAVNIIYMNYGSFNETDISGEVIGEFKAKETALNFAGGRQVAERLTAGAQLKFIFSNLEQYSSFGMGADLGLTYHIEEEFLTTSLVFKNMGAQLSSYYEDGEKNPMPFNIQLAVSKRMKHAPFRLLLTLDNLQKWDLTYTDPNLIGKKDPLTGDPIEIQESSFGDKLMRHVLFGGEILIGDVFSLQLAYNYRRRKELKVNDNPGMSGLSFGFGLNFKSLNISYSLANYTRSGTTNQFTLAMRFNNMKKENILN